MITLASVNTINFTDKRYKVDKEITQCYHYSQALFKMLFFGRYTTVIMHYNKIYYDFLYKTVIRLWVKMYDISCINMTL